MIVERMCEPLPAVYPMLSVRKRVEPGHQVLHTGPLRRRPLHVTDDCNDGTFFSVALLHGAIFLVAW